MNRLIFLFGIVFLLTVNNSCQRATEFAAIHGTVSDRETGEPLSMVLITLMPGGKTETTDLNGYFEFRELDVRRYEILAQKAGYDDERKVVMAVANISVPVNITLTRN